MLTVREAGPAPRVKQAYQQLFPAVYRKVPGWHAPPMAFHMARLSPKEEPIWRSTERHLLIAERDGRAVGRLLVFVAPEDLRKPAGERTGRFAFFDVIDDAEPVDALFREGLAWLRARGCREVVGPLAFSMHDEVGLLVEGFDRPPSFLMPFNPPQAAAHLARLGFEETRRFTTYEWALERDQIPLSSDRKDRKTAAGLLLRGFDLAERARETRSLLEVYNAAFDGNWGFEALTQELAESFVDQFIRFGDPRLVRIAELDGRAVGFILCVPDPNRLLHATRRQPDLLRLARLILAVKLKRLRHTRVITLAVRPEHRRGGVAHGLIRDLATTGRALGYLDAELSYIDAGNDAMNTILTGLRFPRRKAYALYRRALDAQEATPA